MTNFTQAQMFYKKKTFLINIIIYLLVFLSAVMNKHQIVLYNTMYIIALIHISYVCTITVSTYIDPRLHEVSSMEQIDYCFLRTSHMIYIILKFYTNNTFRGNVYVLIHYMPYKKYVYLVKCKFTIE